MLRAGAAAVNENIEHLYLVCESRDKPDMLRKLLHALDVAALDRVRASQRCCGRGRLEVNASQTSCCGLNSELSKMDRKRAMDGIRNGASAS